MVSVYIGFHFFAFGVVTSLLWFWFVLPLLLLCVCLCWRALGQTALSLAVACSVISVIWGLALWEGLTRLDVNWLVIGSLLWPFAAFSWLWREYRVLRELASSELSFADEWEEAMERLTDAADSGSHNAVIHESEDRLLSM